MIFHFYCDFWKFCHPKMLFQNLYWYISPLNLDSGHFLISTCWSISAAAAKSLQSCPTLCNPIDGSPPGSPIPGILQARTLEWVAISFSNAWKWKVKVKSLHRVWLLATPWTAAYQAPPSMDFPGKSTGVECHCLLNTVQFLGRNAPLLLRVICPVWPPGVMQKYRQLKMNFHVPVWRCLGFTDRSGKRHHQAV